MIVTRDSVTLYRGVSIHKHAVQDCTEVLRVVLSWARTCISWPRAPAGAATLQDAGTRFILFGALS